MDIIHQNKFYKIIQEHSEIYEGCGNMLLIVPLEIQKTSRGRSIRNNFFLRKAISEFGIQKGVDSVMVLTGTPLEFNEQGYHCSMDVFEPRGQDESKMAGSWSIMCGNGARAVVRYWLDHAEKQRNNRKWQDFLKNMRENPYFQIMTRSGLRTIEILSSSLFKVRMGVFTSKAKDLEKYVNIKTLDFNHQANIENVKIPNFILDNIKPLLFVERWSIGLTGNYSHRDINGEPHVVMLINDSIIADLSKLRKIAKAVGPWITKAKELFPQEINTNFVVIKEINKRKKEIGVIACTYERGLGDNPSHCVTEACGTGATVVGAVLFRQMNLDGDYRVKVKMPGGVLIIEKNSHQFYYLIGTANRIEH